MNFFIETSALAKAFHEEKGTKAMISIIDDPANTIWVSELARVEYTSAVFRKVRMGEFTLDEASSSLEGFLEDFATFEIEPISETILATAEKLIRESGARFPIRSLDAIHIATYLLTAEKDWAIVSTDSCICSIARDRGWPLLNPEGK
jgi:predicted nucleic acid-binding protein